jgi:hypothetical protein
MRIVNAVISSVYSNDQTISKNKCTKYNSKSDVIMFVPKIMCVANGNIAFLLAHFSRHNNITLAGEYLVFLLFALYHFVSLFVFACKVYKYTWHWFK